MLVRRLLITAAQTGTAVEGFLVDGRRLDRWDSRWGSPLGRPRRLAAGFAGYGDEV